MSPIWVAAYLALFATVGFLFLLVALLLGRLLRARSPTPGKLETYECGEPTIGSGFVQFDLRFYVVALVFLIFDVEVAFFFPWAAVYGKSAQLMDRRLPKAEVFDNSGEKSVRLSPEVAEKLRELGVRRPAAPASEASVDLNAEAVEAFAGSLAAVAMADMAVFFGVLLVGYAYVWSRGDLNWVRAVRRPAEAEVAPEADVRAEAGS